MHVWAIRELGTETELNLQELPASPQGVTFLPDYGGKIRCRLYVTGPQVSRLQQTHAQRHTHARTASGSSWRATSCRCTCPVSGLCIVSISDPPQVQMTEDSGRLILSMEMTNDR